MDKRQQILNAATDLFLELGYGPTNMEEIAQRANVAKQTVYNHFASKETLFAEILKAMCGQVMAPLLTTEMKQQEMTEALQSLGRLFVSQILTPEALAFHRTLISESARFPELGKIAYDTGPAMASQLLADYLTELDAQGQLQVDDPHVAAEFFFGMLVGYPQFAMLMGATGMPPEEEINRQVDLVVKAFIRAYRPD